MDEKKRKLGLEDRLAALSDATGQLAVLVNQLARLIPKVGRRQSSLRLSTSAAWSCSAPVANWPWWRMTA